MTACNVKFMAFNFADSGTATFTAATSGFPASNCLESNRGKYWLPLGSFTIDAGINDNLYIFDGAFKTVTLTAGTYTAATLATEVQTRLNASSSNWTCTYSATTRKFTINRTSGTGYIRLQVQTTAAWSTLGFTGTAQRELPPFLADEPRKHSLEYVKLDLGVATEVNFVGIVGPIDEVFGIGVGATVTLRGNNVDLNWSTAPFSEVLTVTERGIFHHLDADSDKYYRYWRLEIYDPTNPADMKIGNIYIGDSFQPTSSNIGRGFSRSEVDPSKDIESESGHLFFDIRTQYTEISGANISNISAADRLEIERISHTVGRHTPLYISFDPLERLSDSPDELSWYCYFDRVPEFAHLFLDYYTINMTLREAV